MDLENDINQTNEYYINNNIAIIHKKPTAITIHHVDYTTTTIKEAYFKTPSTTDYNGIYKGHYIDFEAKETKNKTSFPLSNIHPHQLNHLESIMVHGGIGFIIVRFTTLNKTYLLNGDDLFNLLKDKAIKSIPINYFIQKGFIIKEGYIPRLDYLKIIDILYFGGSNEKIN